MKKRFFVSLLCIFLSFSLFVTSAFACGSCIYLYPSRTAMVTSSDGAIIRSYHSKSSTANYMVNYGDILNLSRQYDGSDYTWYYGIVTSSSICEGCVGWIAHSTILIF